MTLKSWLFACYLQKHVTRFCGDEKKMEKKIVIKIKFLLFNFVSN